MKELNLREKRIKRGWSFSYVGNYLGITKQYINNLEQESPNHHMTFYVN